MSLTKKEEIEQVKESVRQGEGFVEAARSGFKKIGDKKGQKLADDALDTIKKISKHVKKSSED